MRGPGGVLTYLLLMVALGAQEARAERWPTGLIPGATLQNGDGDPVVVLVHGIEPERDLFYPISYELSVRRLRPMLFQYDDARPLDESADRLVEAIATLPAHGPVRVIAHSLGSLVARRAMTDGRALTLSGTREVELVTVAGPFAGFKSANPTVNPFLGLFARLFGLKASFRDVAANSRFVRQPGKLGPNVRHLKIETLETKKGDITAHCNEQEHETVDLQAFAIDAIATGHVESFRTDAYTVSRELMAALGRHGALDPQNGLRTPGRALGCRDMIH
jgi:pimeloyl-ACP methyl ester carboxylesterase